MSMLSEQIVLTSHSEENIELLGPPFLEPSDDMCQEITKQTELVFSDASLSKDTFLLKHVKRNKEGFVNLKLLISAYKPIKRLTQDWRQIAFAIRKCSSKLEINNLGTKIRRLDQVPCYDPATPFKTIVATNFPMASPTIKDVVNIFSACGEIVQVRILRPGNPTSGDIKKYLATHPQMEGRVCAFVEFETHDLAQKAVTELTDNEHNLELHEYTEPPPTRKEEKVKKDPKSSKKKIKPEASNKMKRSNMPNWRDMSKTSRNIDQVYSKTVGEVQEDDIGYSSDNNEVIDNNEWTQLVNRTVAMVFEDV